MKFKNKKVVISGGAGFIGTHLSNYLNKLGAIVWSFDIKPRPKTLLKGVHYAVIDARDGLSVKKYLKGCDIFYNLACNFGGTKYIHENQAKILSYNAQIFTSTFNAASQEKVGRIIFPSSSLAYNEKLRGKVSEEDMEKYPPTTNPYGFMKLTGEYFCKYFWNQYKLPFTIVRMFNVYGPGDTHQHAIPNFIKQALSDNYPFEMMGDGSETRVFTYIDDIVQGLAKAAISKNTVNETANLSSEGEISMMNLAKIIWKLCKNPRKFKKILIPIPSSTPQKRSVSAKKIFKLTSWKAKVPFKTGLKETIKWIKTL